MHTLTYPKSGYVFEESQPQFGSWQKISGGKMDQKLDEILAKIKKQIRAIEKIAKQIEKDLRRCTEREKKGA